MPPPRPERPSEPNAGVLRFAPGSGHPVHNHYFAQVWYILEGEFDITGKLYRPGTMVYHPDLHVEARLHTETGGKILFVQYRPTTRKAPIYDGRFNWRGIQTWHKNASTTEAELDPGEAGR